MEHPVFHRTRLAPTPSGYLHLGNVFSFVLTAGLAEKFGAKVLLRIDDMDRERARDEYIQDIFDTLHFLEIPWHEGPRDAREFQQRYAQQHRMPLYEKALNDLLSAGKIFACNCTRSSAAIQLSGDAGYPGTCMNKQLPMDGMGVQWRMHTEACGKVGLRQLLSGPLIAALPASMRHVVLRRKDGKPSYQLCSLVDDLHFQVDLVVRGQDLLPSSILQSCLSDFLPPNAFRETVFFHHLLLEQHGMKMSKSAGATSVHYLRKQGANRADVYQQIARLSGLEPTATDMRSLFSMLALQMELH